MRRTSTRSLSSARVRRPLARWPLALALGLPFLAACAHDDESVPSAAELLQTEETTSARVAGVRVRVDGDPDLALPYAVVNDVTPVRIVVENQSSAPLRIRYRELRLVETSGRQKVVLPPFMIEGEPLGVRTAFGHARFRVAPGYERFYSTLSAWDGPFATDPYYLPTNYARWVAPLPTAEMLSRALPEGVLEAGGRLDGLLYFEGISPLDDRVTLVAELVNANSGAPMGTLRVPFRAVSDHAAFARRP